MNVSATPVARMLPVSTPKGATSVAVSKGSPEILSLLVRTQTNARLRATHVDPLLFVEIQIRALSANVPRGLVETEMLPAKLQKFGLFVNPISTVRTTLSARRENVSVEQASQLLELSVLMLTNVEALQESAVQMLSAEIHSEASPAHASHLSSAVLPAFPVQVFEGIA